VFRKLWLLLFACSAISASAGVVRNFRVTTTDDIGITGTYYPVDPSPAPAVILVHGLAKSREDWEGIAPVLQRNGIAAVTFDLRGHGGSTRRLTADGPQLVDYRNFRPRDFHDMLLDLNAVYDWLADQPGIDRHRIGILGANLGANLALRYAAVNEDIAAVLLFSPALKPQDVKPDNSILKLGPRPLRIVVARGDADSFQATKKLLQLRKDAGQAVEASEITASTGSLQGSDLIRGVEGLPEVVFGWLQRALRGEISAPAP
jgi:dienelactone hydrolase